MDFRRIFSQIFKDFENQFLVILSQFLAVNFCHFLEYSKLIFDQFLEDFDSTFKTSFGNLEPIFGGQFQISFSTIQNPNPNFQIGTNFCGQFQIFFLTIQNPNSQIGTNFWCSISIFFSTIQNPNPNFQIRTNFS